jgi:non-ribosomal peptide synthetase component F
MSDTTDSRRLLWTGFLPDCFCGEAMPWKSSITGHSAPNSVIENIYGSTELTVGCTACRWDNTKSPDECEQGIVPIGQSFDGIQTLIVDEQLREWKDGRDGELLMIGPQLYLVIGRTGKRLDGHLFPSPATTVPTTER